MAVNLTWHSFLEQVWGIRLRCRTNCTCCETSELQLFRTRFHLVREPAAAKHKRHFAPNAMRLRQLGQRNDKCGLNMRTRTKTQKQVFLALSLTHFFFFCTRGDKRAGLCGGAAPADITTFALPRLQQRLWGACAQECVQWSQSS